jgi:hypothetical protein
MKIPGSRRSQDWDSPRENMEYHPPISVVRAYPSRPSVRKTRLADRWIRARTSGRILTGPCLITRRSDSRDRA